MDLHATGAAGSVNEEGSRVLRSVRLILVDNALVTYDTLAAISSSQISKGVRDSLEIQLVNSIENKIEILKLIPEYGDQVQHQIWPAEFVIQYGLTNLWRMDLANGWRMIYFLRGDRIEVVCFVVEICDHKRYNELFHYHSK